MIRALRIPLFALLVVVGAPAFSAGPAPGTFLYIHDRTGTDRIFGFTMDGDGMIDPLPGSPFASPPLGASDCGGYCQSLSYSKKRKLLFRRNWTDLLRV